MQPRRSTRRYHLTPSSTEPPPSRRGGEAPACNRADYGRRPPPPRLHLATRRRSASAHALLGRRRAGEGLHPGRRRAHCLARGSEAQRSAPEGLRRRRAAAAWTHSRSPPLTCTAFMDRSSKRRQVKPLAASLLEALDYDSSDDSDFKVGDASDSEGSGHGSEDASKDSGEGSCTESEENILEEEPAEEKVEEQQPKSSTEEEVPTADKEVIKTEKKEQEDEEEKPKKKKEKEKAAETDPVIDEQASEPKKWNLRRNRPLLDFVSMEELNDMDDYDSEDDNDWRPTPEKKKGKNALRKEGSDGDNEDDEDDGSGSDEDDNDEEGNEEDNSSTASDGGSKKKKSKVLNRNNADDEELTNDSLALSQSKSNEDSLILEKSQNWSSQKMDHILICCVCLGDNSEDADEIIQCDNCGITVHEGCYGVDGESDSIMSSASENSTEPWFCDACKCGVTPSCELCPNQDGIFKETDAGRWVHIVCALYVPGVAFGDIDKLRPVTLTEMNYSKYGAKECSFCEDPRFARTGVCISCDAGMCRAYFHVTCAQKEGLLSEAAAEEDIADPFFAYCKQHADRLDRKWKRKNYLALQSYCKMSLQEREKQLSPEAQARINARLQQYRAKAELARTTRPQAWVPREKLPRPLTSSASAIRKLMRKAELMGISTDIFPVDTSDTSSSVDGRRKHKQPALTADFVNYYLERNMRMIQIQENMAEQRNIKDKLENEQEKLHVEYNKLCESLEELQNMNGKLRNEGQGIWALLGRIIGQKLNIPAILRAPKERKPSKKEGGTQKTSTLPAVLYSCGICKKNHDQHLLLLCDTCKLHYHLGCLDPPLTRMPRKTKNSYWQCSECDQAGSSDMEADIAMETLPDGTKRSRRQIKEPVKFVPQDVPPEPKKIPIRNTRTRGRKRSFVPDEEKPEERIPRERRQRQSVLQKKPKSEDLRTECATCKGTGDNENLVRCDECRLCYHFGCLDPPLKKSPKQTGYGWICQECDSTSSKDSEPSNEVVSEAPSNVVPSTSRSSSEELISVAQKHPEEETLRGENQYAEFPNSELTVKQPI
ncbi:PHD finger protein 14 isoform X2 [Gallus gallus]|nr:PHD finger protein 14 isoform X2 [Gallus gallus]XP_046766998.1 PHD finger protein 14 isoform X2 [Gallus gallus]|eukprot:XP_015136888.1 PHD finger protein 14 isoform X2 [Gallus gallus]